MTKTRSRGRNDGTPKKKSSPKSVASYPTGTICGIGHGLKRLKKGMPAYPTLPIIGYVRKVSADKPHFKLVTYDEAGKKWDDKTDTVFDFDNLIRMFASVNNTVVGIPVAKGMAMLDRWHDNTRWLFRLPEGVTTPFVEDPDVYTDVEGTADIELEDVTQRAAPPVLSPVVLAKAAQTAKAEREAKAKAAAAAKDATTKATKAARAPRPAVPIQVQGRLPVLAPPADDEDEGLCEPMRTEVPSGWIAAAELAGTNMHLWPLQSALRDNIVGGELRSRLLPLKVEMTYRTLPKVAAPNLPAIEDGLDKMEQALHSSGEDDEACSVKWALEMIDRVRAYLVQQMQQQP